MLACKDKPHHEMPSLCLSPGFFADGGSPAQGEFLKAASALRESYRFGHTNSEELLQTHNIEGE